MAVAAGFERAAPVGTLHGIRAGVAVRSLRRRRAAAAGQDPCNQKQCCYGTLHGVPPSEFRARRGARANRTFLPRPARPWPRLRHGRRPCSDTAVWAAAHGGQRLATPGGADARASGRHGGTRPDRGRTCAAVFRAEQTALNQIAQQHLEAELCRGATVERASHPCGWLWVAGPVRSSTRCVASRVDPRAVWSTRRSLPSLWRSSIGQTCESTSLACNSSGDLHLRARLRLEQFWRRGCQRQRHAERLVQPAEHEPVRDFHCGVGRHFGDEAAMHQGGRDGRRCLSLGEPRWLLHHRPPKVLLLQRRRDADAAAVPAWRRHMGDHNLTAHFLADTSTR